MNKIDCATVKAVRLANIYRRFCAHQAGGDAYVAGCLGSSVIEM